MAVTVAAVEPGDFVACVADPGSPYLTVLSLPSRPRPARRPARAGSGKSNLMDAISFVLGVQSAQLRGTALRDLVYSFDLADKQVGAGGRGPGGGGGINVQENHCSLWYLTPQYLTPGVGQFRYIVSRAELPRFGRYTVTMTCIRYPAPGAIGSVATPYGR